MNEKTPTVGSPTPTKKPAFFVLNEATPLTALLDESICLTDRIHHLADLVTDYQISAGSMDEGKLLSMMSAIGTQAGQLMAILERFQEVEQAAKKAPRVTRGQAFSDEDRARFLLRLQEKSDMETVTGTGTSERIHQLEGMVELADMLAAFGFQIPADVAAMAEGEIGRVGK